MARPPTSHLVNVGLLAAAVGCLFGFNYVVDPFALNRVVDLGLDKRPVSYKLSYWNWKCAEYANDPFPGVLIGDSRMLAVPEERVSEEKGVPFYDFAYGGGNMADMLSTYWFAHSRGALTHAIFGFDFKLLNDGMASDRVKVATEAMESPIRYYLSPFTTQASVRVLLFDAGLIQATSEVPPMDRDAFWDHQLAFTRRLLETYRTPARHLENLEEVIEHGQEHGVELTFVLLPSHMDLQETVRASDKAAEVDSAVEAFRRLARESGVTLYDYSGDTSFTRDRASFKDPYHFAEDLGLAIATEIAGGEPWGALHE